MKKIFVAGFVALMTMFGTVNAYAQQYPHGNAFPQGASWENGFSIDGTALPLILKVIGSAHRQILVAAYAFTNREITQALIQAHANGVQVYVIADEKENQKYTSLGYLVQAGIPVRLTHRYAIMHNKFIVADGLNVQTGSFNYTQYAVTNNAENVVINWNFLQEATNYINDWNILWNGGYNYTQQ
jgi:phosphatidylserine/phosphatidylglycerophosphate/cardiolipin synthase-like enzyme